MSDSEARDPEETLAEAAVFTEEFSQDDEWVFEPSGPSLATRSIVEFVGTFALVLIGVGAALLSGGSPLEVGLAFGIVLLVGSIVAGRVSGAHFNPAVTLAAWIAGRLRGADVAFYFIAQVLGALSATGALVTLIKSYPTVTDASSFIANASIGSNPNVQAFPVSTGLVVEALLTALFIAVVLAATAGRASKGAAPYAIGLSFAVLLMLAIPFTGGGLNPARATATAVYVGDWALSQLWAWWVAPLMAAAVVGLLFRAFAPEDEEIIEEVLLVED